jgi:hypothetical protein
VITGASYAVRSTDVLDALGWQTLDVKRLENKLIMIYKVLNDHTAPNLSEFFCKRNTIQSNYDLKKTFDIVVACNGIIFLRIQKILKPFLLLKEKYVRHEHFLWIAPIVKFLYNSIFIILCFLVFLYSLTCI